eukprot:gene13267-biopygen21548
MYSARHTRCLGPATAQAEVCTPRSDRARQKEQTPFQVVAAASLLREDGVCGNAPRPPSYSTLWELWATLREKRPCTRPVRVRFFKFYRAPRVRSASAAVSPRTDSSIPRANTHSFQGRPPHELFHELVVAERMLIAIHSLCAPPPLKALTEKKILSGEEMSLVKKAHP